MHIPDGYLGPPTCAAAYAACLPLWYRASRVLERRLDVRRVPLLALSAAFSFLVMMFNVPLPGGSTGHAVGGVLTAIAVGPWGALLAISIALAIQALLFGDGGVTALGANCFNIAFVMPFTGYLAYRILSWLFPSERGRAAAAGAAGWIGLNAAALTTAVMFGIQPFLHTGPDGRALYAPYPLSVAVPAMMVQHLFILGPLEALVTGLVVRHLLRSRSAWMVGDRAEEGSPAPGHRRLWAALAVLAALSPLGLYLPSLVKSGPAWGEWGVDEVRKMTGYAPRGMERTAGAWRAPLPDYALPGREGAPLARRGLFYVLCGAACIALCGGGAWLAARRLACGRRREREKGAASPSEAAFYEAARARGLAPPGVGYADRTLRGLASFFRDALVREEAARRPAPLSAVDPRARLLAFLVFVASVSLARSTGALLAHLLLPAAALLLSRIRLRELMSGGFLVALLFALAMAAPVLLNLFRDGTVVFPLVHGEREWRLGPFLVPGTIGITREGILSAETFLLRVLSSAAAAAWLVLSTRWVDLLHALGFLRLPPILLRTAGMTVRYVHLLLRQSEETHLGKKSRTICRGRTSREQAWAGSRIAQAWERSLHLMGEVGAAMAARGFTGEARRSPGGRPLSRPDRIFLAAVVIFCGGAHLV
jgi:cobalt/nickel transport system permease protein